MKSTIKDVAKLASVSFKTVSRVINNEPSVSPVLKEKVNKAIKKINYEPNLSARSLRGAASSISFIYDNPNSNYVIELQHGILGECRKQGYELLIHPCDSKSTQVCDELLQMVRRSHVGGLVLTPPLSEMATVVKALTENNIKFVRILSGSGAPDKLSPCVTVNDRHAAFSLTHHLADLGHKRIGFLCGDVEHKSSQERLEGYKAVLVERGIAVDPALILEGSYSFDSGVEGAKSIMLQDQKPTAIVACNDEIAAGALFAARMQGIAVPQELSIIGFEDSPFSRQTWPRLTTARQPNKFIAQSATALLISTIQPNPDPEKNDQDTAIVFHPELVIRDSTCTVG